MHYDDKQVKKQLSRNGILGKQSPYSAGDPRTLNMTLTTSADAEGFWTINPPDQFVYPGYVSPETSPGSPVQMRLDKDIDDIAKAYSYDGNQRAAVPAMSVSEAFRQGVTSGIESTSISCHEDQWGNCTGCREHW